MIDLELKKFIANRNSVTNIFRIEAYASIMWEYFCIRLNGFMLKCKNLLDYAYLFFPNKYEKNDKIILKGLQ